MGELADAVNRWCAEAGVQPANGQVGEAITERSIRFYRTIGVVDAPASGGGRGYRERHLLQLIAIRLLQAQGLPLRRIRQLLFGRSEAELEEIRNRGVGELQASARSTPLLAPGESWQIVSISDGVALLCRGHRTPSTEQLRALREILEV